MSEIDTARLGVLGAISRGMGFSYAARADGVTVAQVREIAEAAGWPDVDAVRATWEDLKAATRHPHLPAGAVPLERVPQAEAEYRGQVVQTGPTPEHRESLEDYVTRRLSEEYTARMAKAEDEMLGDLQSFQPTGIIQSPPAERLIRPHPGVVIERGTVDAFAIPLEVEEDELTRVHLVPVEETAEEAWPGLGDPPDHYNITITGSPIGTHEEIAEAVRSALSPATDIPAPASVKRSATRSGTLPCDVCGVTVTAEFAARTGKARHGWHPEEESSASALDFGEVSDE